MNWELRRHLKRMGYLRERLEVIISRLRKERERAPFLSLRWRLLGWTAERLERAVEELERAEELRERLLEGGR